MVKLPDLFVYPVISGEGESGVDERNAADSLEFYRCPLEGCPILSTRFYRKKTEVLLHRFVLFGE